MRGVQRSGALAIIFCAIALVAGVSARGDSTLGELGNLKTAKIEGCDLIPAEQVRNALIRNADVQAAAAPSAPMPAFLKIVQEKVEVGYQTAGFSGGRVRAYVDPAQKALVIHIVEGTRYTNGKLRIVGVQQADSNSLTRRLTEGQPAEPAPAEINVFAGTLELLTDPDPRSPKDPLWEPGQHAQFNDGFLPDVETQVAEELFLQGFCWAVVRGETIPKPDGTADLVVTLVNEGPRATLDQIEITGSKTNTPAQVKEFFGLKQGMPVDLRVLRALRSKLWDSARFRAHDLYADVYRTHPGKLNLRLKLTDDPRALPLAVSIQQANPTAAALIRWGASAQKMLDGPEGISLETEDGPVHFRAALNREKGVVARIRVDAATDIPAGKSHDPPPTPPPATVPATLPATRPQNDFLNHLKAPIELDFVFARDRLEISAPLTHWCYLVRKPEAFNWVFSLKWTPSTDPDYPIGFVNLQLACDPNESAGRLRIHTVLPPVQFYNLATSKPEGDDPPPKLVVSDGREVLTLRKMTLRSDAATGRAIDLTQEGGGLRVNFDPAAFDRELSAIDAATPGGNEYDPKRPVSSFVSFIWTHTRVPQLLGMELGDDWRRVVGRLLAGNALAPLDKLMLAPAPPDDEFTTEVDTAPMMANPLALVRYWLYTADELFAYGSWPWTLSREAMLVATGGSPTVTGELQRVLDERAGPVGCLSLSLALRSVNADASRSTAKAGLAHMGAADFSKDFHDLLQNDSASEQVLIGLLEAVAGLDDQDMASLHEVVPADLGDALKFVRDLARANPGKPILPLLTESQAKWWEQSLRKPVEAELQELAGPHAEK